MALLRTYYYISGKYWQQALVTTILVCFYKLFVCLFVWFSDSTYKWYHTVSFLLVTPWTAAYQASPSMGFSRQEYWSGVPLGTQKCIHLFNMWERYCREGNGNSFQYSCLENPVDRGMWWAAVHGVAQSLTRLKQLSMHACIGEGNGNPLQYSCLENPRDWEAWWAAVYRVTQNWTQLKWLGSSSNSRDTDSPLNSYIVGTRISKRIRYNLLPSFQLCKFYGQHFSE